MKDRRKTLVDILGREAIHPFPARMAPEVALGAIPCSGVPLRILDPMAGSGTVLAVAQRGGHNSVGVDLDPLAVLISKVWTTAIDRDALGKSALEVLETARRLFSNLADKDAYPVEADDETRKFVEFWFDINAQRQLTSLSRSIQQVDNPPIRDALWCAFSRLIITKQSGASLARDLSHSRPHRTFRHAPRMPFTNYLDSVERVAANCLATSEDTTVPSTDLFRGDARNLPLPSQSVDLVVTSPPYLNAIDYLRSSKFSLVWMGYRLSELRQLRSTLVGAEAMGDRKANDTPDNVLKEANLNPQLPVRQQAFLERYVSDMRASIGEVARVLKSGSQAVYVIGENTVRGTFIPNADIVERIALQYQLKLAGRSSRDLPANRRYLPPPSTTGQRKPLDGRLRREVVLTFTKETQPPVNSLTDSPASSLT